MRRSLAGGRRSSNLDWVYRRPTPGADHVGHQGRTGRVGVHGVVGQAGRVGDGGPVSHRDVRVALGQRVEPLVHVREVPVVLLELTTVALRHVGLVDGAQRDPDDLLGALGLQRRDELLRLGIELLRPPVEVGPVSLPDAVVADPDDSDGADRRTGGDLGGDRRQHDRRVTEVVHRPALALEERAHRVLCAQEHGVRHDGDGLRPGRIEADTGATDVACRVASRRGTPRPAWPPRPGAGRRWAGGRRAAGRPGRQVAGAGVVGVVEAVAALGRCGRRRRRRRRHQEAFLVTVGRLGADQGDGEDRADDDGARRPAEPEPTGADGVGPLSPATRRKDAAERAVPDRSLDEAERQLGDAEGESEPEGEGGQAAEGDVDLGAGEREHRPVPEVEAVGPHAHPDERPRSPRHAPQAGRRMGRDGDDRRGGHAHEEEAAPVHAGVEVRLVVHVDEQQGESGQADGVEQQGRARARSWFAAGSVATRAPARRR